MSNLKSNKQEKNKERGERLRLLRIGQALKQEELAESLHIGPKQYARYEEGSSCLSCEKLEILYDEYGFDIGYIITGEKSNEDMLLTFKNLSWNEKWDSLNRLNAYSYELAKRMGEETED